MVDLNTWACIQLPADTIRCEVYESCSFFNVECSSFNFAKALTDASCYEKIYVTFKSGHVGLYELSSPERTLKVVSSLPVNNDFPLFKPITDMISLPKRDSYTVKVSLL